MDNIKIKYEALIPVINDIVKVKYKHNINEIDINIIEGGYKNYVYTYTYNKSSYIIRVSDSKTKEISIIDSELEWIKYLYSNNISVSIPIIDYQGNYINKVHINNFEGYMVVFNKAKGIQLNYQDYLNDFYIFEQMGRIMGKIHRVTKEFIPKVSKRNQWINNSYIKESDRFLSKFEPDLIHNKERLIMDIEKLYKDNKNYGLIHGDFNIGNFFVNNGEITIFDFDECQYSWYIEDVAVALYYTVYPFGDNDKLERNKKAENFIRYFLNGYQEENIICKRELESIPYFLRLRELIVYIGCLKKWNLNNLTQWQKDFYHQSRNRIKNNTSIISGEVLLSDKVVSLIK